MAQDPKIHFHTSHPDAFFVNSFIVEGASSLVLIDTQFVLSEARALAAKITAIGKPLAGIVITHPHPDHYNGLATILAQHKDIPVFATAATIAGIHETAEPKRAYWTPIVGDNYPQEFAFPTNELADGQWIDLGGIHLTIADFGPGECSDNSAISLPQIDAVVISDLVYNQVHPWLAEGRSDKWLQGIAQAKRRFAGAHTLYAGHGQPGDLAILDQQQAYIHNARDLTAQALKTDPALSDTTVARVAEAIKTPRPCWNLEMIVEMNIRSLAGELRP